MKISAFVVAAAVSVFSLPVLAADAYPSKPVRMVIGYPPGGSTDIAGRVVAEALSSELGQPFVVHNRPGANSAIAAQHVVDSKDLTGHTLLFTSASTMVLNPILVKDVQYKPLEDFEQIATVGTVPMVITASKKTPFSTLPELIEEAKKKPGTIGFAAATNAIPQIAVELLKAEAGIDLQHIPYKGGAQALTDALGGHVELVVDTPTLLAPSVRSGDLKGLAVTSDARLQDLPDVPTVAESLPGFEVSSYFAIYGPAGMDDAAIKRINEAVAKVLELPAVRERISSLGVTLGASTPQELKQRISGDIERFGKVIQKAGMQ